MATIRQIIKRDIGIKIEGVVKVFDHSALASEVREYVVTDKIEVELKRIFDTFTYSSEALKKGAATRDVMGMWVSGFFGSGKSHFAKVLGYLLQNDALGEGVEERCISAFVRHLSDSQRGRDVRLRLAEIERNTQVRTVAFEIKSRQSLNNPNSVGEILLSEFYRSLGFAGDFVVARIERRFQQRGLFERLATEYQTTFGVPWRSEEGREDLLSVRQRLAEILPKVDPTGFPDGAAARHAINDMFRHEKITAEGVAEELVAWADAQKPVGGRVQHLVFVIDEMGTFIGDSTDRISELNSLAEMIGNKGKGKVWLIVTSQQDLEKVVDRTNFQPALVGRLNARFDLKPHLMSDEINKVVSERILKKHASEEGTLRSLYAQHEGFIAQLADIKASRELGGVSESAFVDTYPFLPHQIRLAQDIFEALSGFRLSGGVRSMISVVMEALQGLADSQLGAVVAFDQVFDAVENDLLSAEYLGASGVRAIYESDQRVPGTPVGASRVLKVLWLLQRITWVPRVPETLAKLLVKDLTTDVANLRGQVESTLGALQDAGYVARDEATGEWKFLNERERTIEQAIQEMVRPGGPRSISVASVRRAVQQLCKDEVVTKRKLSNFSVTHGVTKIPFPFGVSLDGETMESGPELEVHFTSPLAAGRKQEVDDARRSNQASGVKGKVVWWIAATPDSMEERFKRYEALVKVTSDKRFTDDASSDTQDALAEKRKERDDLKTALIGNLERAFLSGTLLYGGLELALEGAADIKEPVRTAFQAVVPNIYPRFSLADRPFDFGKQLKALLNPSTARLHEVAPDLGLFDTQGRLQKESTLVAQILEVVKDLEDEGREPTGELLLRGTEGKGFRGFTRSPYGWPEDLVKLILAACFRAGALFVEQQTAGGPSASYDSKGTEDLFAKVRSFQSTTFRSASPPPDPEELKLAGKALIAMGVHGVAESSNAIADAVRRLGQSLKAQVKDARTRSEQGLPIPDAVLTGDAALGDPATAKDPTTTLKAFVAHSETWRTLSSNLSILHAFLDDNRHRDFDLSRRLLALVADHPVGEGHPQCALLNQACKDMRALIAGKTVVTRWSDYRTAFESAVSAYGDAYSTAYEEVQLAAEAELGMVMAGEAYTKAPTALRDPVVQKFFGPGRPCHYPPMVIKSAQSLLDAAGKRSLTSLEQALVALPGYRAQVETELRQLAAPPAQPHERVYEWKPGAGLAGRRIKTEAEVDQTLEAMAEALKAKVREGFTVVVK